MHHGVDFNYGEGLGWLRADGVVTYVCTGSLKYVNILHANGFVRDIYTLVIFMLEKDRK